MANTGGLSSVGVTVSAKNYQVNKNTNLQKLEGVTLNYQTNEYKVNEYNSDNYNDVGSVSPTLDELRQEQTNTQTNTAKPIITNQYTYEKTWWEELNYGACRVVSDFANDVDDWLENSGPGVDKALMVVQSFSTGVVSVGEDIYDGVIQLGGSALSNLAELFGEDEFAKKVEEKTQAIVEPDYTGELYAANMETLKVDDEIAYSTAHDISTMAGSIFGYVTISAATGDIKSAVSKVIMPLTGMLSSMGSSAEVAYQSGATFEQAEIVSTVSGLVGLITGGITDKFGLKAAQGATIKEVVKHGLKAGAASMLEPITNSITEYTVYAKDMVDETGEKLYNGFIDYYTKAGGIVNTAFAGITGFGASTFKGVGNKIDISEKISSLLKNGKELLKDNRGGMDLDAMRGKGYQLDSINKYSFRVEEIKQRFCSSFNFDYENGVDDRKIVDSIMGLLEQDEFTDNNVKYIIENLDKLKEMEPNLKIGTWDSSSAYWHPMRTLGMNINDLDIAEAIFPHELGHMSFNLTLGGNDFFSAKNQIALDNARINIKNNDKLVNEVLNECLDIKMKKTFNDTVKWFDNIRDSETKRVSTMVDELYKNNDFASIETIINKGKDFSQVKNILNEAGLSGESIENLIKNKEITKQIVITQNNISSQIKQNELINTLYSEYGDYRKLSAVLNSVLKGDSNYNFSYGHDANYWTRVGDAGAYNEILADYVSLSANGRKDALNKLEELCGSELFNDIKETVSEIAKKMGG